MMAFFRLITRKRLLARRQVSFGLILLTLTWLLLWKIDTKPSNGLDELAADGYESAKLDSTALKYNAHIQGASRQLLFSLENCTPPAIENFPREIFTQEDRLRGAVAIHIVVILYMFLGLAIVCDEYFVPSLEGICEALNMSPDVAGATFMAAGSSAPELATTIIGVFIAEDDIGLGAVVGSAVYNILFVIAVCGLFAGMVIHLNWWPMVRDSVCYAISIIVLACVIADEEIYWYESLILLVLYVAYIVLMYFNYALEAKFVKMCSGCCCKTAKDESQHILPTTESNTGDSESQAITSEESDGQAKKLKESNLEEVEDHESPLAIPSSCWRKVLWLFSLPLLIVMFLTVPDCRKPGWKKWYMVTFVMSCFWICLFSYVMIWMITIAGHTFSIPDTIMALTFLAAGVSVPDAIASLLVAIEGYGDMAVANAIGSNVFDILLCMGLPWFIKTAIYKPDSVIKVYSAGLLYSTLTLLGTVLLLIVSTHLNGWKLNKRYGAILMIFYVIFLSLAILYELNIFGYVHPPECFTDF